MAKRRSDEIREFIEERIATGLFPPGKRLDETELAQEFGVSRTPLREALIQLASLGLVEVGTRRGAVVAQYSPQRMYEMFEVMAELEAMCGRLATRRITENEKKQLMTAHQFCKTATQSQDPDAYYYANEQFHFLIYALSHNSFLTQQARQLHRQLRVYRRLQLRVRDRIANSFAEHDEVVAAILAGNSELTSECLRRHVLVQGERFGDLLASLNALATHGEQVLRSEVSARRRSATH